MKIKTNELQDGALNWAVAKALQLPIELHQGCVFVDGDPFMPESFWYQGGPIIEREGISLTSYLAEKDPYWIGSVECQYKNFNATAYYEEYGPTPLIAAMRCYVASKLGDECDIPDELITGDNK